jgi:hypothetical protein
MIQNEHQYEATKQQLTVLAQALAAAQQKANSDQPEVFRQAGLNGIRFLMEDLEAELAEYEKRVAKVPGVKITEEAQLTVDDQPVVSADEAVSIRGQRAHRG